MCPVRPPVIALLLVAEEEFIFATRSNFAVEPRRSPFGTAANLLFGGMPSARNMFDWISLTISAILYLTVFDRISDNDIVPGVLETIASSISYCRGKPGI